MRLTGRRSFRQSLFPVRPRTGRTTKNRGDWQIGPPESAFPEYRIRHGFSVGEVHGRQDRQTAACPKRNWNDVRRKSFNAKYDLRTAILAGSRPRDPDARAAVDRDASGPTGHHRHRRRHDRLAWRNSARRQRAGGAIVLSPAHARFGLRPGDHADCGAGRGPGRYPRRQAVGADGSVDHIDLLRAQPAAAVVSGASAPGGRSG